MITKIDIENTLKKHEHLLKKKFKVKKIGIFGSFVRNEADEKSDIDILVDVDPSIGWYFIDLKDFLENKLRMKIDLVSIRALKPQLRSRILEEVEYI